MHLAAPSTHAVGGSSPQEFRAQGRHHERPPAPAGRCLAWPERGRASGKAFPAASSEQLANKPAARPVHVTHRTDANTRPVGHVSWAPPHGLGKYQSRNPGGRVPPPEVARPEPGPEDGGGALGRRGHRVPAGMEASRAGGRGGGSGGRLSIFSNQLPGCSCQDLNHTSGERMRSL